VLATEAAVSSSDDACSSVRLDRAWLPAAIWQIVEKSGRTPPHRAGSTATAAGSTAKRPKRMRKMLPIK
jgi:hypothetical protein